MSLFMTLIEKVAGQSQQSPASTGDYDEKVPR